jgi:hypothetical protein
MKRNPTPPLAQPSLFTTESVPTVLPPPKTPRPRAAAKLTPVAAPITTATKTADAKIAKTNLVPKPASKAIPVTEAAVKTKAVPKSASPVKAATVTKSAPAKPVAKTVSPGRTAPVKAAASRAKPKIAKTNPRPKTSSSAAQAVRVVNEPVFEGGMLWKMSGRNGVAYIKDAALAGELLAIDPKKLAQAAMAVYYDKKGKAFAWQVRFDTERWEEVMRRLG